MERGAKVSENIPDIIAKFLMIFFDLKNARISSERTVLTLHLEFLRSSVCLERKESTFHK